MENKKLIRCYNCNRLTECEFVNGFGYLCPECANGIKNAIKNYQKRCFRCGYEWISYIENPKRCPRCNSPYWNIPKKEHLYIHKCFRCGYEWNSALVNPKRCPNCKSPYWNRERTFVKITNSNDKDSNNA